MRLFIIGPRWVGGWTEGMGRAANALGHTATLFFYSNDNFSTLKSTSYRHLHQSLHKALRRAENWLKWSRDILANRRLIIKALAFKPDVIVVLKGETISRETLLTLRGHKIPVVSWWVDDPFRFPAVIRNFELFDMVYMFDKASIADLNAMGIKHVMYLPCGFDPTIFYPQLIAPSDYPLLNCTVGFVAVFYPERAELLSQMKGIDVGIWGSGWAAAKTLGELSPGAWRGQRITAADAAKIYAIAKICPNIHHSQTRYGGLNTRTFEILAAGGFELVDNVPGLEEHFDVGREIVAYSSPVHFRELTEYYLSHPTERKAISERGQARVMRDHTYTHRLATILSALNSGMGRGNAKIVLPGNIYLN